MAGYTCTDAVITLAPWHWMTRMNFESQPVSSRGIGVVEIQMEQERIKEDWQKWAGEEIRKERTKGIWGRGGSGLRRAWLLSQRKGLAASTRSSSLFRRQSDQWPPLDLFWNGAQNVKSIKAERAKEAEAVHSQVHAQDYVIDFRVTLRDAMRCDAMRLANIIYCTT